MPYPKQADTCRCCPTPMPRRANGRRPRCSDCTRVANLASKYGITLEHYQSMFEAQRGLCKICSRPETRVKNGAVMPLSVDHDHQTGQVRGLLCYGCNIMLGCAEDNIETLRSAIKYLEGVA